MEAAASAFAGAGTGRASAWALEPHGDPAPDYSAEASSSSSSSASQSQTACNSSGEEEGVLDLDTPWLAAVEAESRLEAASKALGLGAEAEAKEDEIRDNWQRQEDELMALEAIYGDDLAVFEHKGGLHYFQVYIRYDLLGGVEMSAKLSSAGPKDTGCCDEPDEFSYNCILEYLPPLILTCLLPPSYPSRDPPCFAVTAKWMDGPYVSQVCEMLDTIWAELPGQEVLYQWVEWLRNSSMSYIWSDGRIMLGPDIVITNSDSRAISRALSLESVIPLMLSYSKKKRYQAFLDDLHMCLICLNQSKGSNFAMLPCQHLFCLKCMETLCRMHVKEGSVFQLVCPDTKCNASIPPHVLKRLLTDDEFERWDRLILQKSLDSMSDVVYCPRCVIACVEDEDNTAQCPECAFIFCSFCKGSCHPGKQCVTPAQKIQRRQASGGMTEKEAAQELLNIREIYKDVRLCPRCRMAIAKTQGCNKMVCGNCSQYFCFRCGKAITGYEHFRDGSCQLFAARDIAEWERQLEAIDVGRRMRLSSRPIGGTVRCPKCRANNFKDDERYIFCWSCMIHICTLCRRKVESKKSGHYGSPECMGLE